MTNTKHTLNELLVWLFNYILYIEERNIKESGITLSMNEVHILERIETASDNSMSHLAKTLMITQGTLTTSVAKLVKKGYVVRYKDEKDKRIVRLTNTDKANEVLLVHDAFHEEMIDKVVSDLKLDENEVLIDSLANITEYFQNLYGDK